MNDPAVTTRVVDGMIKNACVGEMTNQAAQHLKIGVGQAQPLRLDPLLIIAGKQFAGVQVDGAPQ